MIQVSCPFKGMLIDRQIACPSPQTLTHPPDEQCIVRHVAERLFGCQHTSLPASLLSVPGLLGGLSPAPPADAACCHLQQPGRFRKGIHADTERSLISVGHCRLPLSGYSARVKAAFPIRRSSASSRAFSSAFSARNAAICLFWS